DRADQVPDAIPAEAAVDSDRVHAAYGEGSELHRKGQDKDQAEPELRDGVPDDAHHADHVILDATTTQRGDHSQRDAHEEGEEEDPEEGRDRLDQTPRDEPTQRVPPIRKAPERSNAARAPRLVRDYFLIHHFSTFQIVEYVFGSKLCSFLSA